MLYRQINFIINYYSDEIPSKFQISSKDDHEIPTYSDSKIFIGKDLIIIKIIIFFLKIMLNSKK